MNSRTAQRESVLLEHTPENAHRVLDLGTGDGRLLVLLKRDRPEIVGVGLAEVWPKRTCVEACVDERY